MAVKTAKIKKCDKVFVTNDYDIFTQKRGNRPVIEKRVNAILKSIVDNGWIDSSLIMVGDNMAVLDGQNRIAALKKYNELTGEKPDLIYMVDRNLDDIRKIQELNNHQFTWTAMDYLHSYIELGNDHYLQYRRFMEEYDLRHSSALALASNKSTTGGSGSVYKDFKRGFFMCNDWGPVRGRAEKLNEIQKYFRKAKTQAFVRAINKFWRHPDFDHKQFINKLRLDREMLYSVSTIDQYVRLIEDVYNFHSHSKVKFDFE